MSRQTTRGRGRVLRCLLVGAALAVSPCATAQAALTVFGSPLTQPATLNTTANLDYRGTYTPVPPSAEAPNGVYHTNHWGVDATLWNVGLAAVAPATGQAVKVRLEGCAQRAAGGPRPLTQIHVQDLAPLADGRFQVKLTSQAFDIPVCGEHGASGSTVTTYEPINLCVSRGDYVGFNDEGGYVPYFYRSGVPYQVMGLAQGSTMDSFIRGNGTMNGGIFAPGEKTANDGFAVNHGEELMMSVTLGTGSDATHICPGGTAGTPPRLPALRVRPQTDGVNRAKIVRVALYCRPPGGCRGVATLGPSSALNGYAHPPVYARSPFSAAGSRTSHVPLRVDDRLMALLRARNEVPVLLTATLGGQRFSGTIRVRR